MFGRGSGASTAPPIPRQDAASQAAVRSAIPSSEAWYQDNGRSYRGLTHAILAREASGISPNVQVGVLRNGQGYCLQYSTGGGQPFYYVGGTASADDAQNPGVSAVTQGTCPPDVIPTVSISGPGFSP
jgi:hypothetical protein